MIAALDNKQLAHYKSTLMDRYHQLREKIRQDLLRSGHEHYLDIAGEVHDLGDESFADLLVDLDLLDTDRDVEEIRDVEAALLRIAAHSYGQCCDCEQPIPIERLQAWPTAKRCVQCQSRHEKSHQQSVEATRC